MESEARSAIEVIVEKDPRYKTEAYAFVFAALSYIQTKLNKPRHVTGKELLEGIRELALDRYGKMAKTVLEHWGVKKTDDFGEIVFNLVEAGLLGKTDKDRKEDFKDVYDFEEVFEKGYELGMKTSP